MTGQHRPRRPRGGPAPAPERAGSAKAPQLRRPPSDPARQAAYDVLTAVREREAYANLVLPGLLRDRRLDTRDAALATELAYGTLRAQGQLDVVLQACVDRPLDQVDPPVLDVLRLGAYQLLRTRIPTHAAVSATVDLARRVTTAGPAAFANAVLRKVASQDLPAWLDQLAPTDPVADVALRTSHPRWIASAFRDALGGDLDRTRAALQADDVRPEVHLVARGMARADLLAEAGGAAGPWSERAVRLAEGDPGALVCVRDGRAGVQDEGSQLMALALAGAPLEGPDDLWLDLCAGPGGKAALLDTIAFARGTRLVALEVQPHRADLVRKSGVREVVTADARTQEAVAPGTADRVLLDAPCSGLGALRRRPEARWRRSPADLPGLTRLQGELLDAAVLALRPGGVLAYVTCSPHLAETVVPVLDVLRRHPELEQLDARPLLPGVPDLGPGPAVQLWPHLHGTDAMHLALLRKRP